MRGRERSRQPEDIIKEIKQLVADGVVEVMLLGQNVNSYGKTLDNPITFAQLLQQVEQIEGLRWIRFMTSHPKDLSDELIEVMKNSKKICRHLHLPLQSGSSRILKLMNRKYDKEQYLELAAKLRREIPDVVLRTTLITGFPGETEEQFSELAEFVNDIKFERLGCFAYSAEEDTPAAEMPDQVDEGERQRRADIITSEQEIRMGEYYAGMVGNTYEVVCEGFDRYSDMYFGRSMHFAPEIDGMIYFTSAKDKSSLTIGDFVNVKITDVLENNLLGERV